MKSSEPGEVFLSRRGWRRLLAVTSWGGDGGCCCRRSCRSHRRHKLAWVHLLHVVDSQPQTSATNKNKTLQLKHHHFAGTGGRFDAFDLGQSYGQLFNFCHLTPLTLYFYIIGYNYESCTSFVHFRDPDGFLVFGRQNSVDFIVEDVECY